MATYVTAPAAVSLVRSALPLRLTIGGKDYPDIKPLAFKIGRNKNPGELTMRVDGDILYELSRSSPSGVWRPEYGEYLTGWKPVDIAPLSAVELTAVDGTHEQVLFRGWVTGWRPAQGDAAEVIAHDARWRMSRMFVHGFAFHVEGSLSGPSGQIVRAAETVFNEKNKPDMLISYDGAVPLYNGLPRYLFVRPYLNTYDGWSPIDSGYYSGWWNGVDIYGYIRQLFTTAAGFGATADMPAIDDWLVLPAVGETPLAKKIQDAVPSEQKFTGKTLAESLDMVCALAGDVSWTVEPDSASGYSRVVFYDSKLGNSSLTLARGSVGAKIQTSKPGVGRSNLSRNYQGVANRVVGIGAKKRVMLTFSTVDGSLVVGWIDAEQTAWVAQSAEEKKNSTQYPNTFLRWIIPYTYAWGAKTGETYYQKRSRKLLPELLEKWFSSQLLGSAPRGLPAQIWRYVGSTWELLPDSITARVLPDEGGFLLSGNARALDSGSPWSWDESTNLPYPMRITAVVECDEHLLSEEETTGPFRLDQFIQVSGRTKETANGAKVHLTGDGDGSEVTRTQTYRDDTVSLADVAAKVSRLVNNPRAGGSLEWDYICRIVKIGTMVDTLTGGGPTRPNILLQGVIHGLTYEFNPRQHTVAEIEAL